MRTRSLSLWAVLALLILSIAAIATAQSAHVPPTAQLAKLKQRAAKGEASAQCVLGLIYEYGSKPSGVVPDFAQAAVWFRMAADQGNLTAQQELASLYLGGQGVPQDSAQAAYWYRKAAEQGDANSQYNLALLYNTGNGVPQDYAEGYFWADLAASGVQDTKPEYAAQLRDKTASELTKTALLQTQERARKWFAAHQSDATAPNDSNSETRKDTETSPASSSIQNAAPQEWIKAETNQIRAMVQAIKQCPSRVSASAASTISDGPPYNVTWDVSPSKSIRAPFAGYIEFSVPSSVQCSQQRRASSPQGCAIVERPQFPLVLRYEYDLSPDGVNLSKILVRRDNETEWSNRPNVSNFCWERAAQATRTAK